MRTVQGTLDQLGTPLAQVTFVVVDLETTGGSPQQHQITEVGAVKVRGGVVLGEFQTLVNPGASIPAFISVLTGITDAMVSRAPRIESVLPAFLEFAGDSVLVAHNAPFDIGFLKAAAARQDLPWPGSRVLDTAHLARQLVGRDEAANRKLATLAQLFGAQATPDHRALHDARATVEVLHALIERVGNLGVTSLEELSAFTSRVTSAQRRKRYLAADVPSGPGVYLFKDNTGRVLYVGTSTDMRRRVRSYFTSTEKRTRMAEMVTLAAAVTPIPCATALEAQVRELRLIAEHEPPYNRRSRRPRRKPWVKLTAEPFPRLSIVREVRSDGATYVGPFASRDTAQWAIDALHDAIPLRQCSTYLAQRPERSAARSVSAGRSERNDRRDWHSGCLLADLGRCGAPCRGEQSQQDYALLAAQAQDMFAGDCRATLAILQARMAELAGRQRYEDAAEVRQRTAALVRAAARTQRLAPLAQIPELLAARRPSAGGWEVICVRHGRLAGTTTTPRGADPIPFIDALQRSAEVVSAPSPPSPAATCAETDLILDWLEGPGVRLVHVDGTWSCPVHGAGSARMLLTPPPPLHPAARPHPRAATARPASARASRRPSAARATVSA